MRAAIGPDGRYRRAEYHATGRRGGGRPGGGGADADRPSRSYAYSDSVTELPLLGRRGHLVAANPDKELRKAAEERGWPIRDFHQPVRMRNRLASAVPGPRASAGAALAAAGVAAVLIWVVMRSRAAGRRAASNS